jgi:hypothetical protein
MAWFATTGISFVVCSCFRVYGYVGGWSAFRVFLVAQQQRESLNWQIWNALDVREEFDAVQSSRTRFILSFLRPRSSMHRIPQQLIMIEMMYCWRIACTLQPAINSN